MLKMDNPNSRLYECQFKMIATFSTSNLEIDKLFRKKLRNYREDLQVTYSEVKKDLVRN